MSKLMIFLIAYNVCFIVLGVYAWYTDNTTLELMSALCLVALRVALINFNNKYSGKYK